MRKPRPTKVIDFNGTQLTILAEPPPHVLFMGSQLQSDASDDNLVSLARVGGLAALCVQAIDGEEVVMAGGMPRDLDALAAVGRGFIMVAFEHLGGTYAELGELFEVILAAYKDEGVAANPT